MKWANIRFFRPISVVVFMILMVAASASAEVILAPGSTWEYTFISPADGWTMSSGGWNTGPAPFGNHSGGSGGYDPQGFFDWRTFWPADGTDGYDLWVRTTVNLAGFDLSSIAWDLGVDNGFALYINGNNIYSANAEGYTSRWEYSGAVPQATLIAGINNIAVALEDHGGLTAFDMQITGNRSAAVPEPGMVLLFGSGLVGLFAGRRMFRRQDN